MIQFKNALTKIALMYKLKVSYKSAKCCVDTFKS